MDRAIATNLDNPNFSFAKLADSMGVAASDDRDPGRSRAPALKARIDIVKRANRC